MKSVLALLVLFVANVAGAAPMSFSGTLRLEWGLNGATLFDQTVSGAGSADVTHVGGDVDAISSLTAGAFTFAGPTFPISDPNLAPVISIRLDAANGLGDFAGLTSGGGGTMGVLGQFSAEVGTPGSFLYLLTSDGAGQGIGLGGTFRAESPINPSLGFFLIAAPWTVGTASNGYGTRSGFSSGDSVRLISPFVYDPTLTGVASSEGFAVLDLTFVPEPGTAMLLGIGFALLGRRRIAQVAAC